MSLAHRATTTAAGPRAQACSADRPVDNLAAADDFFPPIARVSSRTKAEYTRAASRRNPELAR